MYAKLFFEMFEQLSFHKQGHKCFDRSGPFLQIRSHIYIYTEVSKSVEECSMSFRQNGLEQN